MTRRLLTVFCLLACAFPLRAQDSTAVQTGFGHAVIHWGKWVTLGAAVGLTFAALIQHDHAQEQWNQLTARCDPNIGGEPALCSLDANGVYRDNTSETLYEHTVYYDHLARRRIVIGEVSLLASVGMFVMEFKRRQMAPPNIPLHGFDVLIEPTAEGGARLGFSLPF